MAKVSAIAAGLLADDVPALLLDACALLDIIRAPLPARAIATHLAAVNRITSAARGRGCALIRSSITGKEFNDHAAELQNQVRSHLRALARPVEEFFVACAAAGVPTGPAPALDISSLPDALAALGHHALALATPIDHGERFLNRAYQRAINHIRPSRNGAIKDSVMTEEYLELARQLRTGGFSRPLVFLSSNPSDFCSGTRRELDPALKAEFDPLGLSFCMHWPQAARLLGI